jgi:hypothetical protein
VFVKRAVIVTAGLFVSGAALAQGDLRSACRSDYAGICSAYRPGTTEGEECLRANASRVSRTCRAALGAASTSNALPSAAPAQRGSDYR